jgi:ankyrin repeat protein
MDLLIAAGANVNARDNYGETALHNYADNNAKKFMEILIAAGADINARSNSGNTPLHVAASSSSIQAVEFLLTAGADCTVVNNAGRTPLQEAKVKGYLKNADMITRFLAIKEKQEKWQSDCQNIQKYLESFKKTRSLERKIKRHKLLH